MFTGRESEGHENSPKFLMYGCRRFGQVSGTWAADPTPLDTSWYESG